MADFKTNINRICAERGTTLSGLCKRLRLSNSKVTLWNNGSIPKKEILEKLAIELQCSVMDFFAEEEQIAAYNAPLDEDEMDILRVYRSLDRREKHEFMAVVYQYESQHK